MNCKGSGKVTTSLGNKRIKVHEIHNTTLSCRWTTGNDSVMVTLQQDDDSDFTFTQLSFSLMLSLNSTKLVYAHKNTHSLFTLFLLFAIKTAVVACNGRS